MDIKKTYKSLVSIVFVISLIAACKPYKDNYQMTNAEDRALIAMIDTFQVTGFLGRFGIVNDTIDYGYCQHKVEFGQPVVDTLQKYELTGGVVHRDDLTYFITEGFFIDGNIGILYTETSIDSLPTFRYYRLLRKSKYSKGNWYFVENEML